MHFCAAQTHMEITLDKKFRTACFFRAPERFHSNNVNFLKNFNSIYQIWLLSKIMHFCTAQKCMKNTLDKKIQDCMFFFVRLCAFPFKSFKFLKNFDFISEIWYYLANHAFLHSAKTHGNHTMIKNSGLHVFFCAPVRFHSNFSTFWKTLIPFIKYDIMDNKKIQDCIIFFVHLCVSIPIFQVS